MKHKLKSLILIVLGLVLMSGISVFADHDPYTAEVYFHNMDSYTGSPTINPEGENIGNTMNGNKFIFENVDFGEYYPANIEITYAIGSAYTNTVMDVAIDDESNVIGTFTFTNTGGWESFSKISGEVSASGITGKHTVIFICKTSPVGNLRSFKFSWQHDTVIPPQVKLLDRRGNETTNIEIAREVTATAKVDKNTGNNEAAYDAVLIEAVYDADGTMLDIRYNEKAVADAAVTEFNIDSFSKPTGTASVAAFLWDAALKPLAPAHKTSEYEQGTASGDELTAVVSGAKVKISGKSEDERVTILVVPKGSAKSWQAAVQVYELLCVDGSYEYTFKMNESLATGNYTVYVTGENTSETVNYSFMKMSEFYELLNILATESDASLVADKMAENAGIFGINNAFFGSLTATQEEEINTVVKQVFSDNPLFESDDYTPWIEAIQNNIIPELFVNYLKQGAESSVVQSMISDYAELLGIDDSNYKKLYTSENRANVAAALIKNPPSDVSRISESFKAALIIGTINSAGGWGNVDSVLVAYSDDLGISLGIYKNLSNADKAKVCETFFDRNFVSVPEIQAHFNNVIEDYKSNVSVGTDYPLLKLTPGETLITMKVWQENIEVDEEVVESYTGFEDLAGFEWAANDINSLAQIGLVKGKSEKLFAPADTITREEFVALIMRIFGFLDGNPESLTFADADKNAWYAADIAGAAECGVVKGLSESEFGIGNNITRQEIATVIVRAVNMAGKFILPEKSAAAFTDSSAIADYAYDSVIELACAGVINGVSEDKFEPLADASRAEAVVMLSRVILRMQ